MSRRRCMSDIKYIVTVVVNPTSATSKVSVNGISKWTSSSGKAIFYLSQGTYFYSVEAEGYNTNSGYITVTGNQTFNITLTALPTAFKTFLLLHFDANFNDSSKNNFQLNNQNSHIDYDNKKFGASCADFSNGLIYLSDKQIFWSLISTGTYTIDFWYYYTGNGDYMFLTDDQAGDGEGYAFAINSGDWGIYYGNWSSALKVPRSYLSTNRWNHLALVSNNGNISMYINGVNRGNKNNYIPKSRIYKLCIGGREGVSTGYAGLIDEFRISSIARWVSNFTPPTAPYEVD